LRRIISQSEWLVSASRLFPRFRRFLANSGALKQGLRIREGRAEHLLTNCTKFIGGTVIVRPMNMPVVQLQAVYDPFMKNYYRVMEIVFRVFKQPMTTITMLIANVGHRMNCLPMDSGMALKPGYCY